MVYVLESEVDKREIRKMNCIILNVPDNNSNEENKTQMYTENVWKQLQSNYGFFRQGIFIPGNKKLIKVIFEDIQDTVYLLKKLLKLYLKIYQL